VSPTTAATVGAQLRRLPSDAVALRLPDTDVSYAALRRWVDVAAVTLVDGGVGWGSRVLLRVGDDLSRLIVSLAAQSIGAVVVPINPATIGAELAFLVGHSDPATVVADEALADGIDVGPEVGVFVNTVGALTRRRRCAAPQAPREPGPDDPASILYTSGSSAQPRGAVLSHGAHMAMGRDIAALLGATPSDSFLALSPLFHVGGWATTAMPALAAGCSLVLPGPFSASRFWDDVERWRPTLWTTGLAFVEMVGARGGEPPARTPFRHVITNLRPDTWALGRERLGLPLGTYYGLTENDGRGTIALDVDDYAPGFVGRPYMPTDGLRVTRAGESLPAGEVGEIEFRGDCTMTCYFRDEAATASVLSADGWLATGDLGAIDEQGALFFRGRIKNMIKRSGENVSAEEVELYLLGHPDVADVSVLAVPDRVREEEVKAVVVLAPGAAASAERLHRHCEQGMAAFKVPRYIQFVDELPRTISGKPDIAAVRRAFATPADSWDRERESGAVSR
jgi:acyl-CoA synthetase (AMP-forming)/AMP-acid ligase II